MASINYQLETHWRKFSLQQKILALSQAKSIQKGLRDTKFFANYWLGIELNPFQERVVAKLDEAMWGGEYALDDLIESLLHAGNRSGKTVLLTILHIKFSYYKVGLAFGQGYDETKYRTFDISPQSRQAKECLKYIEDILKGRFTWQIGQKRFSNQMTLKLRNFFEGKNENLGELRYTNHSLTYAFSTGEDMGAGFQGLPAGIVTYDEAPLSHHLEDELDSNVYSRLGDYGKLIMLIGTPNEHGKSQQYFYHLVMAAANGENNFLVMGGSYDENIFIPQSKRDSHVKTVKERNPELAKQILHGAFVTTTGVMFEHSVIERLWFGRRDPIEPQEHHEYLISVDWGIADKGDESVFLVWDLTELPVYIVYAYVKQGGDPYELMAVLRNLKQNYNDAILIMDTSSMGGAIFKKLLHNLKPIPFEAGGKGEAKENSLTYAQIFMTKNRHRRIVSGENIEDNPDFGWIRSIYLPKLASQLATYALKDDKLKTDWVSAFYIGCFYLWKKFGDKPQEKKSYHMSRFRVRVGAQLTRA